MNLVPGICTNCGATLSVSKDKDCMICPYCRTTFIVDKTSGGFRTADGYHTKNHVNTQSGSLPESANNGFRIAAGVLLEYSGESVDVKIPATVLKIGARAFEGTMIYSVEIPDSVIEIESRAFADCAKLSSFQLPANLKEAGDEILDNCSCLESLSFSSSQLTFFQLHRWSQSLLPKLNTIYLDGQKLGPESGLLINFRYTKIGSENRWMKAAYDQSKKDHPHRQIATPIKSAHELDVIEWKSKGLCQHCGGYIGGISYKRCISCGEELDY